MHYDDVMYDEMMFDDIGPVMFAPMAKELQAPAPAPPEDAPVETESGSVRTNFNEVWMWQSSLQRG